MEFTNTITGQPWDEHTAEMFPYMCPLTTRNCHSKCICYHDNREGIVRRKSELHYREDGYTYGTCAHFGISIDSNRND